MANTAEITTSDKGFRYVLSDLNEADRAKYLPRLIHVMMKGGALNSAIFQEADNWKSFAVWVPPGKRFDNTLTLIPAGFVGIVLKLGLTGMKRMLIDFGANSDKAKKKAKMGKKYWYLSMIGTLPEARGRGYASKLIAQYQTRAQADGLCIYLEASTAKSREVYKKCGFEMVDIIRMGKGTHAASGDREKGGPGVEIYAMVWRPAAKSTSEKHPATT